MTVGSSLAEGRVEFRAGNGYQVQPRPSTAQPVVISGPKSLQRESTGILEELPLTVCGEVDPHSGSTIGTGWL